MKRRDFLQQTGFGLAAVGVSALILRSDARPTPRSLDADQAETTFKEISPAVGFDDKKDLKPTAARHRRLVSEMFFKDDPKQAVHQLFHPSLAVAADKKKINGRDYEAAVFDIVLEGEK